MVPGIAFGLAASLAAGLLEAHLYEVAPADPWTYLAVSLFVATVALFSCYVPPSCLRHLAGR